MCFPWLEKDCKDTDSDILSVQAGIHEGLNDTLLEPAIVVDLPAVIILPIGIFAGHKITRTMTRQELVRQIRHKQSFLCVGLDPDPARMPASLANHPDGVVKFCQEIIAATSEYCVAYKPNIAFFEALGRKGWDVLYRVAEMLPDETFNIADAKRADIGNSSRMYAKAFLHELNFDAVTVAPYMGHDSVQPFLEFDDKWAVLLALTSNPGSQDLEMIRDDSGQYFFERTIQASQNWGTTDNLMYVVGATHPDLLQTVRNAAPDHFFLVPGVGAQGGDLESVCRIAMNDDVGLLVNATRSIIYASNGEDFAEAAAAEARALRDQMRNHL